MAIVARVTPMHRPDPPITAESIHSARLAQQAEREKANAEVGGLLRFSDSGPTRLALPIGPRLVSRKQTTELQDAIDTLVETYGLAAVKRAVQLIDAANGGGQ